MSSFAEHCLSKADISRFSRQLILKGFGIDGQERLKNSSVLIVGAGGLGCPVAAYLAAAGVGCIGIVDHDTVSIDNLHRQFLHTENSSGVLKVDSIKIFIERLNSTINVKTFPVLIDSSNALLLAKDFDIIVDCSDNVATRYLLNDVAIISKKPLVSGSALGWEGQLTVYGFGEECPCYRCIFPKPPPPETVTNCSDGGVLGPITGLIGSLQSLEVIKIATHAKSSFSGVLFIFDGLNGRTRNIQLRKRSPKCEICGDNPTITELQDYPQFCGSGPDDKIKTRKILELEERISARDYEMRRGDPSNVPILIDTRPLVEFKICHLQEAQCIPLESLENSKSTDILDKLQPKPKENDCIYLICHRGNDSQLGVRALQKAFASTGFQFKDIIGGLEAWTAEVDPDFPQY